MSTTEAEEAGTEDELFVLTAVLLTPERFPGVLGDDYPAACEALSLPPGPEGYGLLFGQDDTGARWTVATEDVALTACAIAAWDCGMTYDVCPDERTIAAVLPGWPLALAVAAPGLPAPHDPEAEPGGAGPAPLAPPDPRQWGPAQRRLGADEIARQWTRWREQVADEVTFVAPGERPNDGVRHVLEELRGYLASPPPPGRVRAAVASTAGDARTLRVDGPGWSLVARADDIAFVLLDDAPREILPVGRGPELPGLLAGLEELTLRTAAG
ncbi:hypothetical protein OIE51_01045 [Streptomyces sp. NBC_01803]|nr:hypothetical protein [Streptomyces sp. NBC_01803]WSA42914.1 hypothetical protein OIE51_01045 [Streptomyces sp. NBC_01803]